MCSILEDWRVSRLLPEAAAAADNQACNEEEEENDHLVEIQVTGNSNQDQDLQCIGNTQGTPKQFDSAGEIQIWKDVCFWLIFQFLCDMPQKNQIYFQYFFVALSHCDKHIFFSSH